MGTCLYTCNARAQAHAHTRTHRGDGASDALLQGGSHRRLSVPCTSSPEAGSGRDRPPQTPQAVKTAPRELYLIPVS